MWKDCRVFFPFWLVKENKNWGLLSALFWPFKDEKITESPSRLVKKNERRSPLKLFFRPFKLKRLTGVCRFELVIGSKTTYFWSLFYFFGSKSLLTKSTPRSYWSSSSFEHCFILFQARETQLYEKGPPQSFLFRCLFRLSKQEKMPSSSFVTLVKTRWHRTPSKWCFPSIWYPRQACHPKITGVPAINGGENGTVIIVVSTVCRSWTWH